MNELQHGVLILIKSAVMGKAGILPDGFSMEEAEKMIIKHQIVGLVYEGAILCGVSKNEPAMQRMLKKYYQQIWHNDRQTAALNKLFAKFEDNHIDYLPVKGLDIKALYPNPAMRTMGDADVLIRMEQYDQIRKLMLKLGYAEGERTGHELIWDCKALHLELHKQLLSSYHPDLQRYYGDGWKLAKPLKDHRYTYSMEDMYIFLFAHFAKHYRRSGIGIRHVLDIWLYKNDNPDMDTKYVLRELTKLRLCEFHDNICKLIDYWFYGASADEKIEYLSEFILNSGSWGSHENYMRFMAMKQKKMGGNQQRSRFMCGVLWIFPGQKVMKEKYPVLNKAPWLLPVMWPIRWVTVLLFRRKRIAQVKEIMRYSSEKEISEYEASLRYVGLHYDG